MGLRKEAKTYFPAWTEDLPRNWREKCTSTNEASSKHSHVKVEPQYLSLLLRVLLIYFVNDYSVSLNLLCKGYAYQRVLLILYRSKFAMLSQFCTVRGQGGYRYESTYCASPTCRLLTSTGAIRTIQIGYLLLLFHDSQKCQLRHS